MRGTMRASIITAFSRKSNVIASPPDRPATSQSTRRRRSVRKQGQLDARSTQMSDTILILASCTERKRLAVPSALRLRTIRGRDVGERAALWWARLMNDQSETRIVTDLYAGGHWSVVRRLPDIAVARGLRPSLWVISAGYGLVPSSAPLHAYSATFAPGHQDSVSRDRSSAGDRQSWWTELTRLKGPERKAPRSIAAL